MYHNITIVFHGTAIVKTSVVQKKSIYTFFFLGS